jgi:SAM-dependent methyltransferase
LTNETKRTNQCQRPAGLLGRFVLWNMNSHHSKVTDWGLSQVSIDKHATVLDIGCGGGKTIHKLAAMASEGKVYGIDHSADAVKMARRINKEAIEGGRSEIQEGSVSHLPFADSMFDVITAVETHFWWPDLHSDMREVFRVLKPGGLMVIVAEIYKGPKTVSAKMAEKYAAKSGMAFLSVDEHREMFRNAGYTDIQIVTEPAKAWICCMGRKSPVAVVNAGVVKQPH